MFLRKNCKTADTSNNCKKMESLENTNPSPLCFTLLKETQRSTPQEPRACTIKIFKVLINYE